MNVLSITGILAKDIEMRRTTSGISVVTSTIAVQRAFKGPDGEKQTDFIDFVAWDKKAEYLSTYAKKGDRLEITGRLESRKYKDRDGKDRTVWECIVENVVSFSKEPKEKAKEEQKHECDYDSLPF